MNPTPLIGRVAVVTGAGTGLGRECAVALGDAGATVVLIGRTQTSLSETAQIMSSRGHSAPLVRHCDVTHDDEIDALFGELPPCDILINNAGVNVPQPFLDVQAQTLDQILTLNVRAVFRVAQAAARKMVQRDTGVIINMSSQMGHVGAPNRTVYCMSKHAVEGFTKALAVELAPRNIRVNAIAPTYVETPLTRPFLSNPEFRKDTFQRIPLGRIAEPQDVARAVLFLIASPMITGVSLLVDGGYTAQ